MWSLASKSSCLHLLAADTVYPHCDSVWFRSQKQQTGAPPVYCNIGKNVVSDLVWDVIAKNKANQGKM